MGIRSSARRSSPPRAGGCWSGSWRAAYSWGKLKATVGVNNFTNRMPPLAPRTFTDNNVDVATYSPIGRLVYATVSVSL
jgi:hypothetical protein